MEEINLENLTPDVRYLDDMRIVLQDKKFTKDSPNTELYFMYRKVKQENGLVNNITITLSKKLGSEFNKTKGHVHVGDFKEIYTVLEGNAIFLMQKGDGNKIEDVYAVKANKGESIIIPDGYGHVTINPSETTDLKTADWTREGCKNDYSLFNEMHGACYYYIKDGPASAKGFGEAKWVKNENYKSVPELRFEESIKEFPKDLSFLK